MNYVLKNKNQKTYLKYFRDIKHKHYTPSFEEATRFTYSRAYYLKNKFLHPENWLIKKVVE